MKIYNFLSSTTSAIRSSFTRQFRKITNAMRVQRDDVREFLHTHFGHIQTLAHPNTLILNHPGSIYLHKHIHTHN